MVHLLYINDKDLHVLFQSNLHPIYIAMTVEKSPILIQHILKASKVLSLMCEKESKRSENVNEVSKSFLKKK